MVLEFILFDIEFDYNCDRDYLTITDSDGTTLMEKTCGSSLPANITSTSNSVKIHFKSDASEASTRPGWRISARAVTPGESTTVISCMVTRGNIEIEKMKKGKNFKWQKLKKNGNFAMNP